MIFSANSVHLIILCIICYHQRESIVTCEIVVIPMNSRSIVLTRIKKSFIIQSLYLYIWFFLFLTFVSFNHNFAHCWRAFDMSNKYYLLTCVQELKTCAHSHTDDSWCLFNRPVFLEIIPHSQKASKGEAMGKAGFLCWLDSLPFLSPKLHCPTIQWQYSSTSGRPV